MLDVRGVLRDGGQVAGLAGVVGVCGLQEGGRQRLVVREDGEGPAFQKIPEMADGSVNRQKLAVKS